jgi:hypothetical protein
MEKNGHKRSYTNNGPSHLSFSRLKSRFVSQLAWFVILSDEQRGSSGRSIQFAMPVYRQNPQQVFCTIHCL